LGVYVCTNSGSLKSTKFASPLLSVNDKENGAKKSLGTDKNLFDADIAPAAFLRNKLSWTFLRMRSSVSLMNKGRFETKDVSLFSV